MLDCVLFVDLKPVRSRFCYCFYRKFIRLLTVHWNWWNQWDESILFNDCIKRFHWNHSLFAVHHGIIIHFGFRRKIIIDGGNGMQRDFQLIYSPSYSRLTPIQPSFEFLDLHKMARRSSVGSAVISESMSLWAIVKTHLRSKIKFTHLHFGRYVHQFIFSLMTTHHRTFDKSYESPLS